MAVSSTRTPTQRPRWPYFGAPQRRLVFAGFGIWVGTALPWFVFRPLGLTRYASPMAASWVLWAGLMALAGAVVRWRAAVGLYQGYLLFRGRQLGPTQRTRR